jgi:hypothetical protein
MERSNQSTWRTVSVTIEDIHKAHLVFESAPLRFSEQFPFVRNRFINIVLYGGNR